MVAKLKAYRLSENYKKEDDVAMIDMIANFLIGLPVYTKVGYRDYYTPAYIDNLEYLYGLQFRQLEAFTAGGSRTVSKILEWDDDYLYLSAWSNGNPAVITPAKVHRYSVVAPIIDQTNETLIVSDLILEEDFEIIRQIESLDKFDLRVSRLSFSLHETDEIKSFLDTYWNPGGSGGREFMIGVEVEGYFWGFSDWDNINYDVIQKTYHFDSYDPIKWLQKYIWSLRIPSFSSVTATLSEFLTNVCNLFFREGKTLNIDVGTISQDWNKDYVGGDYGGETIVYYTLDDHLTITDMIIECLKHYSATLYYDASGNLNFVSRNKYNNLGYDESNMLEDLNKSYEGQTYAGILLTVQGLWQETPVPGVYTRYTGWALVWEENGEFQTKAINLNLSNIPKDFNYLDLRQELPEKTYREYRVFQVRTREAVYEDYKELLRNSVLYETILDGIDYNLYDKLNYEDQDYIINHLQININERTAKARVYKSLI